MGCHRPCPVACDPCEAGADPDELAQMLAEVEEVQHLLADTASERAYASTDARGLIDEDVDAECDRALRAMRREGPGALRCGPRSEVELYEDGPWSVGAVA